MTNYFEKAKEILYEHFEIQKGERVVIIYQEAPSDCPKYLIQDFKDSREVCETILAACNEDGILADIASYVPEILRNGVEPPADFSVSADIVLAPTVFSITHTSFVKKLNARRVATLPGFKSYMFETIGDKEKLLTITKEYYQKLKAAREVRVTGDGTDITIEINPDLVLRSTGFFDSKAIENIPGAEVFCVPRTANGYFKIPVGFGGDQPLPSPITFLIEQGRFAGFEGDAKVIEKYVKPFFDGSNFNVLAELGIGTNPNITEDYIRRTGWSTLLAEKIYGSAHFANGNSKGMGGTNDVAVHIDWVVPNVKIDFLN
jgi:leucyl aminopeptidase (aminopeptidase T)